MVTSDEARLRGPEKALEIAFDFLQNPDALRNLTDRGQSERSLSCRARRWPEATGTRPQADEPASVPGAKRTRVQR